jgi:DNA repair protein RecN (Recombination protein N)
MERELADLGMDGRGLPRSALETSAMLGARRPRRRAAPIASSSFSAPTAARPPLPLARVASGGELSRILLALKALTAALARRRRFSSSTRSTPASAARVATRWRDKLRASPRAIPGPVHHPPAADCRLRGSALRRRKAPSAAAGRSAKRARSPSEERVAELSRMLGGSASGARRRATRASSSRRASRARDARRDRDRGA